MTTDVRPPDAPGAMLAVMITRRCNMTCAHCSVESSPKAGADPSEADLVRRIRDACASGVRAIRLTGGEPMLRPRIVLRLLRECRSLGLTTSMVSNGFWGHTARQALRHVRALRRSGLGNLTVSYDQYHAEFQTSRPLAHIARAAEACGLPLNVTAVRGDRQEHLDALVEDLGASQYARLRVYDLQAVGRARGLAASEDRETDGFCTACSFPAVTEDGRVIACNGPAYFERPDSPLLVGSLREEPMARLLERHRADPILDTIRTQGPAALLAELKRAGGSATFVERPRYAGMCDLCHHITRDPGAVALLRDRLDEPAVAAGRRARWQVIAGERHRGALTPNYVNGLGAGRLFVGAALAAGALAPDATHVLGSAHLDWRRLVTYLGACGLARPVLSAASDPAIRRWAPPFFVDALTTRAMADARRDLLQRDAVDRIDAALHELGSSGVLLKGTAMSARTPSGLVSRATSDVDILVDPAVASRLRERLLTLGFTGRTGRPASTQHHLEPVWWQGVPIEIHTRIMAAYWNLPERIMLADTRSVAGARALFTLSPEAMLLHTVVHTSASFFSCGLKTAWDIGVLSADRRALDWAALERLLAGLTMPRAFWTPMTLLAAALPGRVPDGFLRRAPADAAARRIHAVASYRLFRSAETLAELDVLTKTGMMLLLCSSWPSRARYLASKVQFRGGRPDTWRAAGERARRADVLRQAWRHFRQYRRAVTR